MLSTLFCERYSLAPAYAHSVQLGGATGAAMLMLARELVRAGRCRNVLVVAGENRLTGQARDSAIQTLAQVGDADFEVPNGASVPAYYALLASRYMHETGLTRRPRRVRGADARQRRAVTRTHTCATDRAQGRACLASHRRAAEAARLLPDLRRRMRARRLV